MRQYRSAQPVDGLKDLRAARRQGKRNGLVARLHRKGLQGQQHALQLHPGLKGQQVEGARVVVEGDVLIAGQARQASGSRLSIPQVRVQQCLPEAAMVGDGEMKQFLDDHRIPVSQFPRLRPDRRLLRNGRMCCTGNCAQWHPLRAGPDGACDRAGLWGTSRGWTGRDTPVGRPMAEGLAVDRLPWPQVGGVPAAVYGQ